VLIFFFAFSNTPPKVSIYSELSEKLIDSLQIPGEEKIISLQKEVPKTSGIAKASLCNDLAKAWVDAGYFNIAGDYLRQKADADPTYDNYMSAGNVLFESLEQDTAQQMRMNVVYGSRYCFEKALELNPDDIDAKIALATVLVQGTSNPMEGIMMLREIDTAQPGNVKVNMVLGNFSIMSRQYDKALDRFQVVLKKDSLNLQARYLMAQSYLGLNDTTAAINTLEEGVTLVQDTAMQKRIRQDINNLKKN
jgi:predicted Zn-dependent protease